MTHTPVSKRVDRRCDLLSASRGCEQPCPPAVAEVVQLGATDATMTNDLELGDLGAVKREGTLNTDTEGHLADGEEVS